MARTSFADRACTMARALDVIGDEWTILILRDLLFGVRRFDALQAELGISRKVLAQRLARLQADGIVERTAYQPNPPRYEYRLTAKGLDLQPLLLVLGQWGSRWLDAPGASPWEFVHRDCGQPARPTARCAACGEALDAHNVRVRVRTPAGEAEAAQVEQCAGRPVFLRGRVTPGGRSRKQARPRP
jgi:DNA-binding HxlR family transcriptional regulator